MGTNSKKDRPTDPSSHSHGTWEAPGRSVSCYRVPVQVATLAPICFPPGKTKNMPSSDRFHAKPTRGENREKRRKKKHVTSANGSSCAGAVYASLPFSLRARVLQQQLRGALRAPLRCQVQRRLALHAAPRHLHPDRARDAGNAPRPEARGPRKGRRAKNVCLLFCWGPGSKWLHVGMGQN